MERDKRGRGEMHFLERAISLGRQKLRAHSRGEHSTATADSDVQSKAVGRGPGSTQQALLPFVLCTHFSSSSKVTLPAKPSLTPPGIDLPLSSHRTVSAGMSRRAPQGRYGLIFGSHGTWDGV